LHRIGYSGTVVVEVEDPVLVKVLVAVTGAGFKRFAEERDAKAVAALELAVFRTRGACFGKTAGSVSARAAIHRALFRGLSPIADTVAARSHAVERAVVRIFTVAANIVTADVAVSRAGVGILSSLAQPVAAGRQAIPGAGLG